jgi:sporulation protein YlmC with PRC-barrel domain
LFLREKIMTHLRFILILAVMAVLAGCKDFKMAPSQSGSSRSATPSGTSTAATTPQATPTPGIDGGGASDNRLAAETPQGSEPAARKSALIFSSSLVGSRVKNSKGEDVGKIKDLLFDPENRRVIYAIVALSNRDIAVPLGAIKMDPQSQTYTLENTDETLAQAPKVESDTKLPSQSAREDLASSSSTAGKQPSNITR